MKYSIIIIFTIGLSIIVALDLTGKGRITHGLFAKQGQFPYQVFLIIIRNNNSRDACGGSLIKENWVLTAAHCMENAKKIIIKLGSVERNETVVKREVGTDDIIIYPHFGREPTRNDIGLIRIPPVNLTENIQLVKLPPIAPFYSNYYGETVITSGWGRISDNKKVSLPLHLRYLKTKVVTQDFCRSALHTRYVRSCFMCVSTTGGISSCGGDSGGAVILESTKVQIGINSFVSSKGCESGKPAAFTRVTAYLEWIKNLTGVYS